MATEESLSPGDKVEWHTPQGVTRGKIIKKLTAETHIEGHKVAASPEHPEYLVESEKSGKRAAHRASALKKLHS